MRLKIMSLRAHLLFVLFSLSLFTFAQTKNDDKKSLQGKWVLEDISFVEVNDTIHISVSSVVDVEVYTEMEIKEDTISLVFNENTQDGKYVVDENFLRFNFRPISVRAEWAIFENKLYLEQIIRDSSNESKTVIVTSIYRRKSTLESIRNKKNFF